MAESYEFRVRFLAVVVVLAGCRSGPVASVHEEAARLRTSFEKYAAAYRESVEAENRLRAATIGWLKAGAVTASRTQAISEARQVTDRWARIYFVPRHMHEQLRFDVYASTEVRAVQQQMLEHLKRRYFELHEYQRYAQAASETEMHHMPAGRLAVELVEFRSRLEGRRPAVDELGPFLATLECLAGANGQEVRACR